MTTEQLQLVAAVTGALLLFGAAWLLRKKPSPADHLHNCFMQQSELKKLIARAKYDEFDQMQELIDDFTNTYRGKVNGAVLQHYTSELNNQLANRVIDSGRIRLS